MALAAVHDDGEVNQNTVFIDTSLDTHLATIVSDSDTVSDLKQKIMLEHRQCYPDIGDIRIECLKVKRRGIFYRLSDSMPIKSAFRDAKRNWYVSVDVSRFERDGGTQHMNRHTVGDQLALPWVTDSRSIDRHDSHADRPLKPSLAHISTLTHPKDAPFVNQKVSSVDQLTSGGSCKDVTKQIEDDRSYNDGDWRNPLPDLEKRVDSKVQEQPYAVNEEINSEKRTLEMHNESLLEDASESGPSVKKKHKTQKVEGNVNVSQENIVLTLDTDKVKYTGASISNENSFKRKSKSKSLSDENTTINKGENFSALDQVATAVPSSVEDVGEETCPRKNTEASENVSDVAMVVDNNILQEMPVGTSQKEKDNQLVHKVVMENEIPSSLMRTSDCELGAPGITGVGHLKGSKHKAAEKEVSSTSSIKELHNINVDANDSSQKDVGSICQQSAGNQINKHKKDKGDGKRKKSKKSTAKDKDESLVKNADNMVGDMSSTVPVPVFDEKTNDKVSLSTAERNEVSEKTAIGDHLVSSTCLIDKAHNINKDAIDSSQKDVGPTVQESAGDQIDKHKEARGEGKKRKSKRSAAKNEDESLVKHTFKIVGDMSSTVPAPVFDEKIIDEKNDDGVGLSNAERNDFSEKTCKDDSLVNAAKESDVAVEVVLISKPIESVVEKSVKELKDTKKSRKRKKDESLVKHADNFVGDMSSAVSTPVFDERNDDKVGLSIAEMNDVSEKTFKDDSLVKTAKKSDAAVKVIKEVKDNGRSRKKKKDVGKSALRNDESVVKPKDVATVINEENLLPLSERKESVEMTSINALHVEHGRNDDILINNDVGFSGTEKKTSQVNAKGVNDNLEKPNEKMDDVTKKSRKKKIARKSAGRENESSKHQSTELEIGPDKVKSVELHPLPEEASKNMNVFEVSKAGMEGKRDAINQLDIPKDKSHEIDFRNYFVSGHQPNKIASIQNGKDSAQSGRQNKPIKRTKEPPLVETSVDNKWNRERDDIAAQSQKSCLINENSKVSIDVAKESKIPNIDLMKTPIRTRKIDTNKGHNGSSAESSSSSSSESFGRSFLNRKSNKRHLVSGQTQAKTVKKNPLVVNSSQNVKSLLNTPGTIFGNDTDESAADDNAAVNSDSSTRSPLRNALSSSGESASSIHSRRKGSRAVKRKEGGGKNSISSQSRSKNISMSDLLRSSSRFKKAKLTASKLVEDTESEPVDFVPESQPI